MAKASKSSGISNTFRTASIRSFSGAIPSQTAPSSRASASKQKIFNRCTHINLCIFRHGAIDAVTCNKSKGCIAALIIVIMTWIRKNARRFLFDFLENKKYNNA
jgi:hypothetical protein